MSLSQIQLELGAAVCNSIIFISSIVGFWLVTPYVKGMYVVLELITEERYGKHLK
jgi:hypothetical protein